MYRASTPRHEMKVPWAQDEIKELWLTYSQNGEIVLEKKHSAGDFAVTDDVWAVQLTQEETNLFKADYADAQIRILFTDGTSLPSKVFRLPVLAVLNDEVMT